MKLLILMVAAILGGCATSGIYTRDKPITEQIEPGMQRNRIFGIAGRPARINRLDDGHREQWVYNKACPTGQALQPLIRLYFEGKKLVEWEELPCE